MAEKTLEGMVDLQVIVRVSGRVDAGAHKRKLWILWKVLRDPLVCFLAIFARGNDDGETKPLNQRHHMGEVFLESCYFLFHRPDSFEDFFGRLIAEIVDDDFASPLVDRIESANGGVIMQNEVLG